MFTAYKVVHMREVFVMKKMYLRDFPDSSVQSRAMACWNSGCTLKQAVAFCELKGFTAQQIISVWRRLYREWYPRPVPILNPDRYIPETNTDSKEYLEWKGVIGMGKQLRNTIAQNNLKS